MSLINYHPFGVGRSFNSPFNLFNELTQDMNSIFNNFPSSFQSLPVNIPPMDLDEHNSGYELKISIPGVSPSDVVVNFDAAKNTLHIKGDTATVNESENNEEGRTQKVSERYSGTFERTVQFPNKIKIDEENIHASLVNGVLTLQVPKVQAVEENHSSLKRIMVQEDSNPVHQIKSSE